MIKVRPNRFFLKNTPASGSILPLISEMPDLPIAATSQILDFSTGDINNSNAGGICGLSAGYGGNCTVKKCY